jgi:hypothetical protein
MEFWCAGQREPGRRGGVVSGSGGGSLAATPGAGSGAPGPAEPTTDASPCTPNHSWVATTESLIHLQNHVDLPHLILDPPAHALDRYFLG